MRLYIDLSPKEEADIHGWVNKGLNDPAFADNPWRIVLEERTRARFDQIAAQFGDVSPPTPYPVDIKQQIMYPDNSRKLFAASREVVVAFPFVTPSGPFNGPNGSLLYMSTAEFQGAPLMKLLTVSAVAGDMNVPPGSPLQSGGKQPTVAFHVGVEVPPNTLMYANILATEDFLPGQSGSGFSIAWPQTPQT